MLIDRWGIAVHGAERVVADNGAETRLELRPDLAQLHEPGGGNVLLMNGRVRLNS